MRAEILAKIHESSASINLMDMKIADDEIQEIMDEIKQFNPEALRIYLDNNNISNEGAIILSKNLSHFKHIEQLSLQFNNIDKEGALHLFRLKEIFSGIDIMFHGNKITNVVEMEEIEHMAKDSFKI